MLTQCDTIDELGCNKDCIVFTADLMDCENVWMIECGRGLRFLNEAPHARLIGSDFAGKEFQRDRTTELGVLRLVDLSHSSRTNLSRDAIVGERSSGG